MIKKNVRVPYELRCQGKVPMKLIPREILASYSVHVSPEKL